jgi:sulfate transport system ATP-binding protein
VEFGALLARTTGGSTTLLTVVPADAADGVAAGTRDALESLRGAWSGQAPRLDSRVRSGDNTTEILLEAQEGLYEVVVIGQGGRREEEQMTGLGTTARRVLMEAGVPVLVLEESRPQIDRVLICTAAGEPGKTDIRFGGRLARRTGAETTVLHVRPGESTPAGRRRAEHHLEQAGAFLGSLGVRSEIKLADGPLVETILAEAKRGDYDLIVIGAPAPRAVQRLRWRDFATSIVSGTERPVLVVPMRE